jgi:hypothetical protein
MCSLDRFDAAPPLVSSKGLLPGEFRGSTADAPRRLKSDLAATSKALLSNRSPDVDSILKPGTFAQIGPATAPVGWLLCADLSSRMRWAPLSIDMIQPFLIFTALLIIAAVVVVGLAGPADLARSQRKQTSEGIPTGPTAPVT